MGRTAGMQALHSVQFLSLPPATKLGQGNIFKSVCPEFCPQWETCMGGGSCMEGGQAWQGVCVAGGHVCHAHPHPPTPGRYYSHGIRSMSWWYASHWNAFLFVWVILDTLLYSTHTDIRTWIGIQVRVRQCKWTIAISFSNSVLALQFSSRKYIANASDAIGIYLNTDDVITDVSVYCERIRFQLLFYTVYLKYVFYLLWNLAGILLTNMQVTYTHLVYYCLRIRIDLRVIV